MRFEAIAPDQVSGRLAAAILGKTGAVRVALDGPRCVDPGGLADRIAEELRAAGRPAIHVRAETFWRDASVRLEHGHEDVDAFLDEWLDAGALQREVLDPLGPDGSGEYLPSLRDPATNRATREPRHAAAPGTIAIVSGELLLRPSLPFDFLIHLAVSAATRARSFPPEDAWTLPAFERYDTESDPLTRADIIVKLDDPRHPAISAASRPASRQ